MSRSLFAPLWAPPGARTGPAPSSGFERFIEDGARLRAAEAAGKRIFRDETRREIVAMADDWEPR